jgi:hypothetical protein
MVALSVREAARRRHSTRSRSELFPGADDGQFADAYAQTITYALLLARFEGDAMFPALSENLDRVLESALFSEAELPKPTEAERKPPSEDDEESSQQLLTED